MLTPSILQRSWSNSARRSSSFSWMAEADTNYIIGDSDIIWSKKCPKAGLNSWTGGAMFVCHKPVFKMFEMRFLYPVKMMLKDSERRRKLRALRCKPPIWSATGCPTFLISTAGPCFTVLGAVITSDQQDLGWVELCSSWISNYQSCKSLLGSKDEFNLAELKSYYEGVNPTGATSPHLPSGQWTCRVWLYRLLGRRPRLHHSSRTILSQDIVVKFADRYCWELNDKVSHPMTQ